MKDIPVVGASRTVLGRAPRAYADWVQDNLPAALGTAAHA